MQFADDDGVEVNSHDAYVDRYQARPGMILPDDEVVSAFTAIGWEWGGDWTGLEDYIHFSTHLP